MTMHTKVNMDLSFLNAEFVNGIGVSISVPVLCAIGFSRDMASSRFF